MLKGIPKIINGDVLKSLSDMGHGDLLAIVDANYPAVTIGQRVIEMPGISATEFLQAIMPLFPVDHIVKEPAVLMAIEQKDRESGMNEPEIFMDFKRILNSDSEAGIAVGTVSRHDFYELSKKAFVIVHTGEERLYGDILLYKGVI